MEKEFFRLRSESSDLNEKDFISYEKNLSVLLEDPDEIWEDDETLENESLSIYFRDFSKGKKSPLFHIALVYLTEDTPSFIFLHFPTTDSQLVEHYKRGEVVFDEIIKNAPLGAIEGDALLEGDELAVGLYEAMKKLRSSKDISEDEFRSYSDLRESTIEEADEIWRNNDSLGNGLVRFIKEFQIDGMDLFYVVVTVEDTPSNSHALLFSFPTADKGLVDRYRTGENLQAEEVVQESSH